MKLKTDNPYNEVLDIIKASSGFYYTDYIVRLRIAGDEENVYLDCDGSDGFEWNYDWADVPSEDIELLGFCPFNKAMLPQEENPWNTTPVTDPGWYLLKLRRDGEIAYQANRWADICGFQWVYAMRGEIIGWRKIED